MSELFAFRRKRAYEVCSDDVSRRNQRGQLGEILGEAEMPVELVRSQPPDEFLRFRGVVSTTLTLENMKLFIY